MNQSPETRPHANDTRLITLTQGQFAIVDAADYEWLMQWKWCANYNPSNKSYYAKRGARFNGKQHHVFMHREILGLPFGDARKGDHRNRQTLDNRRCNLRRANASQNMQNRQLSKTASTGVKGVYYEPRSGKYWSKIGVNGKRVYLGTFPSVDMAQRAYREAAALYHKEFATP